MKTPLRLLATLFLALLAIVPAQGDVTVYRTDAGFYHNDGSHYPYSTNYVAGDEPHSGANKHRNFFVFDIPSSAQTYTAAFVKLWLPFNGYSSPDSSEDFQLLDYVGSIAALQDGTAGLTAYGDLGSGVAYSPIVAVPSTSVGSYVLIPLNASGLAAVNAVRGAQIAFGGALQSDNPASDDEAIFKDSGGSGNDAVLVLQTASAGQLVNSSFETVEPLGGGPPTTFGDWAGDQASIVTAENGIAPASGSRMLKFTGTEPAGGGTGDTSTTTQYVDLSPFAAEIAAQRLRVLITGKFNRIDATDSEFAFELIGYDGTPSAPGSITTVRSQNIITDGNPATWQEASNYIIPPAGTKMVAVNVLARENITNNPASPEFDGNYADDLQLMFIVDSTEPPTLLTPASGARTSSPMTVSFRLPETALAGSVKLAFTGTATRMLTLAATMESNGDHTLSIPTANPTASPDVAGISGGTSIPDGTYTMTQTYQDAAQSPAATSNAMTGVVIDTTGPMLGPVTIASNNASPAWAKLGNTVTLSFTANEPIQTPSVTLLGVAATVANPSGNNWSASATVGAGTAEGTSAFSIFAIDLAGNPAAATATTNGSSVKVDKTAPALSLPANMTVPATSVSGAAFSFAASATDNLDSTPAFIVSPTSGSVFPLGTTTVNASATDAVGNMSAGNFTVTVEDRTNAPVFANASTVPLTTDGFTATGLSVGALTLGFDPAPGEVLTLVNNTSADPIGGTFTDLANGGTLSTTYGGRSLLLAASYTGGTGNDITLTLLAPEIAVEQSAGSNLTDGGTKNLGITVLGAALSHTFTIRNTGEGILNGLTITRSGADAAAFSVTSLPTAPLNGPTGSTTFTVQFAPATSGQNTAVLHIASDDADENPFDQTLSGHALSANEDSDGDGLNDAAEFLLAALGYDWEVSQPALVSTLFTNANVAGLFNQLQLDASRHAGRNDVTSDPNAYSLYTLSQVQALNVGTPLLAKDPMTGRFKMTIGITTSADLIEYQPFPFTDPGTAINGSGKIEFEFTAPGNAAFFRLEAQ